MTSIPDIHVLRHGETEWNRLGRMQGTDDSPLTALGRDQAARQRDLLAAGGLDGFTLFSSPQGRAVETAKIAFGPAMDRATLDPRLAEIDVGDWTGAIRDDLRRQYPQHFPEDDPFRWYDRAPGGEGYAGLKARCRAFLDDLGGPAIIVTHGITSRMLRALALGWPTDKLGDLPGGQGVIHRVRKGRHDTLG